MLDHLLIEPEHEATSAPKQNETVLLKKSWEMPELTLIQVNGTSGGLFDADFSPQS